MLPDQGMDRRLKTDLPRTLPGFLRDDVTDVKDHVTTRGRGGLRGHVTRGKALFTRPVRC